MRNSGRAFLFHLILFILNWTNPGEGGRTGYYVEPNEIGKSNLTIEQIFKLLQERQQERAQGIVREGRDERIVYYDKEKIAETCGKISIFECGNKILTILKKEENRDLNVKCTAKELFLECIENHRLNCKNLIAEGIYPVLPPRASIKEVQENLYKNLWTSGACVLGT